MTTDTEPGEDSHATLWQALCWLAYNDFDAHDPDGDGSVRQELKLAWDTSGHKVSLLEAVRDGKVSFEGRLGVHCDPPPSPADTWREYHRAGHSLDYSPIEPKDWPKDYADSVIGWNPSALLTPRGEFIDVRVSRVIVCAWHPGPASQAVRRQISLADQALEAVHRAAGQEDQPRPTEQKQTKRKRDIEADARLKIKIEMVLAKTRRKWRDPKKRPGIDVMAKELDRLHSKELGYKFEAIRKILNGTYSVSKGFGIHGL